jgi:hypothetical protein
MGSKIRGGERLMDAREPEGDAISKRQHMVDLLNANERQN